MDEAVSHLVESQTKNSSSVPSPTFERDTKEHILRSHLMQRLAETGEKDRLKDVLRAKLIECGWKDEMKELCKDIIRSRGLQKITVDEIVADILPGGRNAVPEDVKSDMLREVRDFMKRDRSSMK